MFSEPKKTHANSKFCKYAWQSLWFKLKVVWWKYRMHKRRPMWIFLFKVLVYVWMVSSAATDATLKFSSDNERCVWFYHGANIMFSSKLIQPSRQGVSLIRRAGCESTLLKPTGRVSGQEYDFKHAYFTIYRAACICLTCLSNLMSCRQLCHGCHIPRVGWLSSFFCDEI